MPRVAGMRGRNCLRCGIACIMGEMQRVPVGHAEVAMRFDAVGGWRGLVVVVVYLMCASANAADWGTLRGRFVRERLRADADNRVDSVERKPGQNGKPGEEGVEHVVVWLNPSERKVPVHSSLLKAKARVADLTVRGNRWNPRVLVFSAGSSLRVHNRDDTAHDGFPDSPYTNVIRRSGKFHRYKFAYDPVQAIPPSKTILFPKSTTTTIFEIPAWKLPVQYRSSFGPQTHINRGALFSAQTPYFAVSDKRGRFVIKHLPTGKWTFQAWHEATGYVRTVRIGGKLLQRAKGAFEVDIKRGDNRSGDVVVLDEVIAKEQTPDDAPLKEDGQ